MSADLETRLVDLQTQIDALSTHLQTLADTLTDLLTDRLATPRPGEPGQPVVRWTDLSAPAAADTWPRLRGWVDWLRRRYALDPKTLPGCWYAHGALVEELTALWTAHTAAYAADAHPASPASWHDTLARTLPRLRDWADRTGCTPAAHHPDITTDPGEPDGLWQQHLTTDRHTRTRPPEPGPTPT